MRPHSRAEVVFDRLRVHKFLTDELVANADGDFAYTTFSDGRRSSKRECTRRLFELFTRTKKTKRRGRFIGSWRTSKIRVPGGNQPIGTSRTWRAPPPPKEKAREADIKRKIARRKAVHVPMMISWKFQDEDSRISRGRFRPKAASQISVFAYL